MSQVSCKLRQVDPCISGFKNWSLLFWMEGCGYYTHWQADLYNGIYITLSVLIFFSEMKEI